MGLLDQVIGSVLGSRGGGLGGGLGGGAQRGGMNPIVMALLALLANRATSGRGGGLGGMLGGSGGGLGGGLGGMGGGMGGLGGLLAGMGGLGGLGSLVNSFSRSGHGDVIDSWIGPGENRHIDLHQLNEALGPETVDQLSQETGLPQQDLLAELSSMLPGVVDKLTPQGRMPTDDEMQHW